MWCNFWEFLSISDDGDIFEDTPDADNLAKNHFAFKNPPQQNIQQNLPNTSQVPNVQKSKLQPPFT